MLGPDTRLPSTRAARCLKAKAQRLVCTRRSGVADVGTTTKAATVVLPFYRLRSDSVRRTVSIRYPRLSQTSRKRVENCLVDYSRAKIRLFSKLTAFHRQVSLNRIVPSSRRQDELLTHHLRHRLWSSCGGLTDTTGSVFLPVFDRIRSRTSNI